MPSYILTLSCPNRIGIVAAVAGFLAERQGDILESAQFDDRASGRFFMRVRFEIEAGEDELNRAFAPVAEGFRMEWLLADAGRRPRLLILVSKFGHCLNDLLYRYGSGLVKADIAAVVSNHRDFYRLAASYDVPFHHLPVTAETKAVQERKILELVEEERIDCVVLARYMQILSRDLCVALSGRAINIHHSFLPSFKGAAPYTQAHARGVKLIGATAHYVTPDLDEGPIIEQDVVRVDHTMTPDDLMAAGRDVECSVLARAVRFHIERRVLPNGNRTVVFR
ncbi:formyltetrahydrofolate deformylase [Salinarimonas soli]|uniref:Formyltetrahydrofolate deformylase n=1 Tax=Salinarimonas soli TaxID=1638099 RepID=A0A5B2VHF3_9HYPH|nr:formyltetrahydrofolate deformylase [Salinarimonas soli]KAA2237966.1 formyltetrahydrofolate deformylase [Salinarimonas soli]